MEWFKRTWGTNAGRAALLIGGVLFLCVVGVIVSPARPPSPAPAAAVATQVPQSVAAVATAAPQPTVAPRSAEAPAAAGTPAPVATETAETHYVQIARAGATIPIVRANLPKGTWKADVLNVGAGPEVTLTMPVTVGLSKAQTVRQAKRHLSQVVKALFDGDPALVRVTAIGTTPDGPDQSELPALSIFVTRAAYGAWDGTAENLGDWRIAPRFQ